jgi:cyclopropane-fatty-acyl-phospholipid synthase
MTAGIDRIAARFDKRYATHFADKPAVPFAIRDTGGRVHKLGGSEPRFTLVASNARGMSALETVDSLVIAEAYVSGAVDIEGDVEAVLSVRDFFADTHPLVSAWHMLWPRLRGQEKTDKQNISHHYDIDPDFFLSFLDKRHRCYSHGIFQSDD